VQGPAQGAQAMPPPPAPPSYFRPGRPAGGGPFLVLWPYRYGLEALESGSVIRAGVTLALRILGVVVGLSGVYVVIETLKLAFTLPTTGTIGGIMAAALIGFASFSALQIYFYRAASVSRLGPSPFTVIPIFSILFRTIGEVYAISAATVGVAGCLFTWFSGMNPASIVGSFFPMPPIPMESQFLVGLAFLVFLELIAFGALILFYFLAEAVLVIADIALNVRLLVKSTGVSAP